MNVEMDSDVDEVVEKHTHMHLHTQILSQIHRHTHTLSLFLSHMHSHAGMCPGPLNHGVTAVGYGTAPASR